MLKNQFVLFPFLSIVAQLLCLKAQCDSVMI